MVANGFAPFCKGGRGDSTFALSAFFKGYALHKNVPLPSRGEVR